MSVPQQLSVHIQDQLGEALDQMRYESVKVRCSRCERVFGTMVAHYVDPYVLTTGVTNGITPQASDPDGRHGGKVHFPRPHMTHNRNESGLMTWNCRCGKTTRRSDLEEVMYFISAVTRRLECIYIDLPLDA